jgi:hypothetical protein
VKSFVSGCAPLPSSFEFSFALGAEQNSSPFPILSPGAPMVVNSDIPPKLEDVIKRALEKDRNMGYQSAADIRPYSEPLK